MVAEQIHANPFHSWISFRIVTAPGPSLSYVVEYLQIFDDTYTFSAPYIRLKKKQNVILYDCYPIPIPQQGGQRQPLKIRLQQKYLKQDCRDLISLYSVYCTLYTAHFTLIHCTLYTVHCTLHTLHLYTLHCTLYTVHFGILEEDSRRFYTVYTIHYIVVDEKAYKL